MKFANHAIRSLVMNKTKRLLLNFVLGAISCLCVVSIATPSFSHTAQPSALNPVNNAMPAVSEVAIDQRIASSLQAAESALIAQMPTATMTRYVAVLTKDEVVPTTPSTMATGAGGAVLMGDRLVVRGDFRNLAGTLRDYATDPLNPPNPKITSAVHIHQGDASKNGPFQYALTVTPDQTGLNGRFSGEYTLTSEQLQALSAGQLYLDIHTKKNRGGELRGILKPLS
jgi:hypothetical protein